MSIARLGALVLWAGTCIAVAACAQSSASAPANPGDTTPAADAATAATATSTATAPPIADSGTRDTSRPGTDATTSDTSLPPSDAAPVDAGHDAAVALTAPPPMPAYSNGTCPKLVAGSTAATSLNTAFMSTTQSRNFYLLIPPNYDPAKKYPVLFGWHWLNASASSFVSTAELETAVAQMDIIAVVPDHLMNANGSKAYQLDWPFVEFWGQAPELTFFDDMLSCVSAQYSVDPARVYAVGVSAGALWVTFLSTSPQVEHIAAVESLSGGLGQVGPWQMQYVPQPNKFPAIVLWGGPSDWLVVNFAQASQAYRDALRMDDHFVVECTHDAGHAVPPIPEPTDGGTRFAPFWQFMLDHPYGLPPGTSPYQEAGLPSTFPTWCQIAP